MSVPLAFLRADSIATATGASLGEVVAARIADSGKVTTLLDCLCATSTPAIYSPESSRPPLSHQALRGFVSQFSLPCSNDSQLGPNDRVMLVLETGPENALALLAIASYHTCAPVNANCTAAELRDDVQRLGAKAVVTTRAVEERLGLSSLRDNLGCQIIYVESRSSGPAGLFDMKLMGEDQSESSPSHSPSTPHTLSDISLVLHTSGTSGKKKVVRYSLGSLLVGTWSVVESWGLQTTDVNCQNFPSSSYSGESEKILQLT